jgi:hypothetical protein
VRNFKLPLILTAVIGVALIVVFSEPISQKIADLAQHGPARGPEIGKIVAVEGHLKRVRDGDVDLIQAPLEQPIVVLNRDRIEVDGNSRATLLLNSKDEFDLDPLTAVSLQLWNERDANSAVYLTLQTGTLALKHSGVKGKAYVVRDGRLYSPGQKPSNKPMALTVLKSAPLDLEVASSDQSGAAASADFEPDPQQQESEGAPTDRANEPETLSNEYIDEMITSRQNQFQKCWLSRLKDSPDSKGQITLQFEISRYGRVKDVRISDTNLQDENLKKCVIAVVERISFRTFKGSEIDLTYPISFE